jgi:hypothetical protein
MTGIANSRPPPSANRLAITGIFKFSTKLNKMSWPCAFLHASSTENQKKLSNISASHSFSPLPVKTITRVS